MDTYTVVASDDNVFVRDASGNLTLVKAGDTLPATAVFEKSENGHIVLKDGDHTVSINTVSRVSLNNIIDNVAISSVEEPDDSVAIKDDKTNVETDDVIQVNKPVQRADDDEVIPDDAYEAAAVVELNGLEITVGGANGVDGKQHEHLKDGSPESALGSFGLMSTDLSSSSTIPATPTVVVPPISNAPVLVVNVAGPVPPNTQIVTTIPPHTIGGSPTIIHTVVPVTGGSINVPLPTGTEGPMTPSVVLTTPSGYSTSAVTVHTVVDTTAPTITLDP
ncbi:MAG: hypothetical protein KAG53_09515, partial [Endozoicomonadaceae bacterium]|nr:hypothetical protein [Endozoicomonadaceae bacterium]